jgi:hypothetical protein
MQRVTILFIIVSARNISRGFSDHHQELKNCTHSTWYMLVLLAATASVVGLKQFQPKHASGGSKQACDVYSFSAPDDGRRNRPKHVKH